jgi:predicted GNAT family acetyltransferase
MKLIHFQDPEEFQKITRNFLLEHEAENNLPIGILASIISGEYLEKTPYMGLVEENGVPILVMICTPPYPVLFTYREIPPPRDVLLSVLKDLREKLGEDFTGITGNKILSAELVRIWKELTNQLAEVKIAMRIYKLDQVIPPKEVPGKMRPMVKSDRELLLNWYANFIRDTSGEEPDPKQVEKQVGRYLNADPGLRGLMIWEVDGKPVSMSGYSGPTPNGIRIGAVYTPEHLRRKGYATACTAALSQYLLDQGSSFCFLFTDLLNPTSNHIYQQIGYRPICDVDRYDFAKSHTLG